MLLNVSMFLFVVVVLSVGLMVHFMPQRKTKKRTYTVTHTAVENISCTAPGGQLFVYSYHDNQDYNAIPFSYALVTVYEDNDNVAFLWNIYTREKYRRQGYAREIIRYLQTQFDEIITQYDRGYLNQSGVRLCVSCGFEIKPKLWKNVSGELIWRKDA